MKRRQKKRKKRDIYVLDLEQQKTTKLGVENQGH